MGRLWFVTKWSSGALVIFLVWSGLVGSGLALVWSCGKINQSLPVFLMHSPLQSHSLHISVSITDPVPCAQDSCYHITHLSSPSVAASIFNFFFDMRNRPRGKKRCKPSAQRHSFGLWLCGGSFHIIYPWDVLPCLAGK
jgi:hypothetical protein